MSRVTVFSCPSHHQCPFPPQALRKKAAEENCEVVVVSAKVEAELQQMDKVSEIKYELLQSLQSAFYCLLGLISIATSQDTYIWIPRGIWTY